MTSVAGEALTRSLTAWRLATVKVVAHRAPFQAEMKALHAQSPPVAGK